MQSPKNFFDLNLHGLQVYGSQFGLGLDGTGTRKTGTKGEKRNYREILENRDRYKVKIKDFPVKKPGNRD